MRQRRYDYCDIDQMITGIGLTADVFHCHIYTVLYEHFRENGHKIADFSSWEGMRFFKLVSAVYFNNPALLKSYSQALIKLYDYADIKRHSHIHFQIFGMVCGTYTTQVASRGNSVATKTTQTI